jgi:hypothetical protein
MLYICEYRFQMYDNVAVVSGKSTRMFSVASDSVWHTDAIHNGRSTSVYNDSPVMQRRQHPEA